MSEIYHRAVSSVRKVHLQQHSPIQTAGVVVEPGDWQRTDPFLIMAHDVMKKGVFGVHPHRGFETVTYMIDGTLNHYDSKSGEGVLYPGDTQWVTTGKGVEHLEDAAPNETVQLLQLWVNLPAKDKMKTPRYQDLRKDEMPQKVEDGVSTKVFSGTFNGLTAPTLNYAQVTMVEFKMKAGSHTIGEIPGSYNGFLYVLKGAGTFGAESTPATEMDVLWLTSNKNAETSAVSIQATEDMHVMLYAGKPLGEPVVANGPFVMNTEEEINKAYVDYQNGTFLD